jgi:hypothetical protein
MNMAASPTIMLFLSLSRCPVNTALKEQYVNNPRLLPGVCSNNLIISPERI